MVTLKEGIDVKGAKTAIVAGLYTVKYDPVGEADPVSIFPSGSIIAGKKGKLSLYKNILGSFIMGNTKEIVKGMRGSPSYGVHDAQLTVLKSGLDESVIDDINEIGRKIQLYLRDEPTMGTDGLRVMLRDENNPFERGRFNLSEDNTKPQLCSGININLTVLIADIKG